MDSFMVQLDFYEPQIAAYEATPEPGTWVLFVAGAVMIVGFFWRRDAKPSTEVRVFANAIRQAVATASFERGSWPRIRPYAPSRSTSPAASALN